MLFNPLRYFKVLQVGILVVLSLSEVCDVLLGTPRVSLDRFFPNRRTESPHSNIKQHLMSPGGAWKGPIPKTSHVDDNGRIN